MYVCHGLWPMHYLSIHHLPMHYLPMHVSRFEFEMKGSSKVSTLDQRTHYRQAAVVLPQSKTCSFNDQVEITAKIVDGALFIDASVGAQL